MLKIVIAGGGTGGHIFPAISILDSLLNIVETKTLWIGTGKEIEKQLLKKYHINYVTLNIKPIKGKSTLNKLLALTTIPISIVKLLKLLKNFNPDVVLGVGGYVSGPVILASKLLGIKTAIHEQNLLPGLANKLAANFADVIFVSFEDTKKFFKDKNVIYTGNPIRKEILTAKPNKANDKFNILILGGSQGASTLNKIVSETIVNLFSKGYNLNIIHQTGKHDYLMIKNFYEKNNITATVQDFIHDIGTAYANADLIISRAGATTISEILALGKPAILIPYPFATDSHQEENAKKLAELGAAVYFNQNELTTTILENQILYFLSNQNKLTEMSKKASMLSKKDANIIITKHLIELTNLKHIQYYKALNVFTN